MTPLENWSPADQVLRVRCAHLLQVLTDGIAEITGSFSTRVAPLVAIESDPDKVRAIMDCEVQQACRELAALETAVREQLNAQQH